MINWAVFDCMYDVYILYQKERCVSLSRCEPRDVKNTKHEYQPVELKFPLPRP